MERKAVSGIMLILLIFSMIGVNIIRVTAQETHDIAVTSVTPSPTSVKSGELVNVTVVVENQGTENETFDVTVYYDTTTIETRTSIILEAGLNKSLTFTWNTTDVREEIYATDEKEKTYTINATATIALDEDPDDNTLVSSSTVKVISHYIEVVPQSTVDPNLTPGKNYTVSIYTDYNGSDVWGWEFTLTYNPSVLEGIEVTNGDLINETTWFYTVGFDNELGKLGGTGNGFFFLPGEPIPVTSGPGTLANVTFEVVGTGDSYITLGTEVLAPTRLIGFNVTTEEEYNIIDDINPDWYHILHGYFCNTVAPVISATIDVDPNALNLRSKGKWITCYIELPEGYNPEDIEDTTILLNETISPVLDPKYGFVTNSSENLVDHNEDGILERMVKFDRAEVMALLSVGEATLTITGEVSGIPFEGSDTIRVR